MPKRVDYFRPLIGTTLDANEFHMALGLLRQEIDLPETAKLTYKVEQPPEKGTRVRGPVKAALYNGEEILVLRKADHEKMMPDSDFAELRENFKDLSKQLRIKTKTLKRNLHSISFIKEYDKLERDYNNCRDKIRLQECLRAMAEIEQANKNSDALQAAEKKLHKAKLALPSVTFLEPQSSKGIDYSQVISVYRVCAEKRIRFTVSEMRELREVLDQWSRRYEQVNADLVAALNEIPEVRTINEELQLHYDSETLKAQYEALLKEHSEKPEYKNLVDARDKAHLKKVQYSKEMFIQQYLRADTVYNSEKATPEQKKQAEDVIEKTRKVLNVKNQHEIGDVIKVYGVLPRYMFKDKDDVGGHATVTYFLGVTAERYVQYIHTFYESSADNKFAIVDGIPNQLSNSIMAAIYPEWKSCPKRYEKFRNNLSSLCDQLVKVITAIAEPYRVTDPTVEEIVERMFVSRREELGGELQIIESANYIHNLLLKNGLEGNEEVPREYKGIIKALRLVQGDGLISLAPANLENLDPGVRERIGELMSYEETKAAFQRAVNIGNIQYLQTDFHAAATQKVEELAPGYLRDKYNKVLDTPLTRTGIERNNLHKYLINGPNKEMELSLRMMMLSSQMVVADFRAQVASDEMKAATKLLDAAVENNAARLAKDKPSKPKVLKQINDVEAEISKCQQRIKERNEEKMQACEELEHYNKITMIYSEYESHDQNITALSTSDKLEFEKRRPEILGEVFKAAAATTQKIGDKRDDYIAEKLQGSRVQKISRCRRFICVAERRAIEVLGNDSVVFEGLIREFSRAARSYVKTSVGDGWHIVGTANDYLVARNNLIRAKKNLCADLATLVEKDDGKHADEISAMVCLPELLETGRCTPSPKCSTANPKMRIEVINEVIGNLVTGVEALVSTKRRSDRAIDNITRNFRRVSAPEDAALYGR